MNDELDNFECHRVRLLAFYSGWWFEKENDKNKKLQLYKIYKYLVSIKPTICDLFDDLYYNDIIHILDNYDVDEDDKMGQVDLLDVKLTLLNKTINNFK